MNHNCLICGTAASVSKQFETDLFKCECPRCGSFFVDSVDANQLPPNPDVVFKFSAYIRTNGTTKTPALLTPTLMKQIEASPPLTLQEKADRLLELVGSRSNYFSDSVRITLQDDYPLVSARNVSDFVGLFELQRELGYLNWSVIGDGTRGVILTAQGLAELTRLRQTNVLSDKVFVAMWFDPQITDVYERQIKPGIEDSGYRPIRIDLTEHNDEIVGRVMTEIRESRFMVAEFTGHRNGVYFEAGFAKGLGLEVVWLCKECEIEKAHFDTNHFNHLLWKDGDNLKSKLTSRILVTIGPGPKRKP